MPSKYRLGGLDRVGFRSYTNMYTAFRARRASTVDVVAGVGDNPNDVTFTQAVAADGGTDISAAEAETLTDGSNADALHTHTGGGGASELSDLSDVNTSTPTNRNVLIADGVDFESRALDEADISDLGDYVQTDGSTDITGVQTIDGLGTGGLTDYDLNLGNTLSYGIARIGSMTFGRTSYNVANLDLDGTVLLWNNATPATSNIEFAYADGSNNIRFALAKSGVGNATYNPRSMLIAGPAALDDTIVTVGYWQGQGIFDNLVCDTSGDGADLGVQNDLEVEGDIFTDSIKESTTSAGVTVTGDLKSSGGNTFGQMTYQQMTTDPYTATGLVVGTNIIGVDSPAGAVTVQIPAGTTPEEFYIVADERDPPDQGVITVVQL